MFSHVLQIGYHVAARTSRRFSTRLEVFMWLHSLEDGLLFFVAHHEMDFRVVALSLGQATTIQRFPCCAMMLTLMLICLWIKRSKSGRCKRT